MGGSALSYEVLAGGQLIQEGEQLVGSGPVAAGDVGIDGSLVGAEGSRVQCGDVHDPPAKAAGQIIEDEDTAETVEKIIAWLDERKLI